jgi:hypothetical protein
MVDSVRFATGWRRFLPAIGYHHVLMFLIAVAIVLLCESSPLSFLLGYMLIIQQHYY